MLVYHLLYMYNHDYSLMLSLFELISRTINVSLSLVPIKDPLVFLGQLQRPIYSGNLMIYLTVKWHGQPEILAFPIRRVPSLAATLEEEGEKRIKKGLKHIIWRKEMYNMPSHEFLLYGLIILRARSKEWNQKISPPWVEPG